jgi:hypothetical protein
MLPPCPAREDDQGKEQKEQHGEIVSSGEQHPSDGGTADSHQHAKESHEGCRTDDGLEGSEKDSLNEVRTAPQYAFRERKPPSTVRTRILMSRRRDQFSM